MKNPNFESGVVKIQRKDFHLLSEDEKEAVGCLLLPNDDNIAAAAAAADEPDIDARFLSPASLANATALKDSNKRKRMQSVTQENYINFDYILGSVAEVERLWSMARYVLQDQRTIMKPMNLEALLFLKVNSGFWDLRTVAQACKELDIN